MTNYDLVLIRGLPGSGKSTKARDMENDGFIHLETDMFFELDGMYKFDASKLHEAHAWCLATTKHCINTGMSVVVSNTFVEGWEMDAYLKLDGTKCIIDCLGNHGSIHNVPSDVIENMRSRWEPTQNIAERWRSVSYRIGLNDL